MSTQKTTRTKGTTKAIGTASLLFCALSLGQVAYSEPSTPQLAEPEMILAAAVDTAEVKANIAVDGNAAPAPAPAAAATDTVKPVTVKPVVIDAPPDMNIQPQTPAPAIPPMPDEPPMPSAPPAPATEAAPAKQEEAKPAAIELPPDMLEGTATTSTVPAAASETASQSEETSPTLGSTDPGQPSDSLPVATNSLPSPIVPQELANADPAFAQQANPNGLVSNVFMESNIREVLADIATQTGQVIVPDNSVQGSVTCELKEVPLEKALEIVLSTGNFAWKKMDGYILVGTCDPESPSFALFSNTKILKLDHLAARTVISMLPPGMAKFVKAAEQTAAAPSAEGKISSNGEAVMNAICITAAPAMIAQLEKTIQEMDKAPRQIMLDARIVVLENGDVADIGTQWNWPTIAAGAFSDSEHYGHGPATGANWPWGIQIGYTPTKEFTNSLLLKLNLLAQNNDATVMANPKLVAVDGREAQLGVTTEEYFEILTRGYYDSSELEKIQAGTTLRIVPHVEKDGHISLDMAAEVSDVVARGSNSLPVVTRRIAQSTVAVEDGGTAVVAGLLDNRTRYNQEHIPLIGRIPFLGRLFRNDFHTNSARQVAVFVTARLVPLDNMDEAQPTKSNIPAPVDPESFREELRECLAMGEGTGIGEQGTGNREEKKGNAEKPKDMKSGSEPGDLPEIKPSADAAEAAKEKTI